MAHSLLPFLPLRWQDVGSTAFPHSPIQKPFSHFPLQHTIWRIQLPFHLSPIMSTQCQEHGKVTDELSNESANTSPPRKPKPLSIGALEKHFSVQVSTSHADVPLLICCIISGLVDSTIYNAFGTFVSMQTVLAFLLLPSLPALPILRPSSC